MSDRNVHRALSDRTPTRWLKSIALILRTFILMLVLSACTRKTVPLIPSEGQLLPPTKPPPAATLLGPIQPAESYSVAWIPEGETLKIHNPAGIAGTTIGELDYDRSGVRLTGGSTSLGSSLWLEVETPGGLHGWVNQWNLTEEVSAEEFCSDDRIPGVLTQVSEAIEARDGSALAEYVNPRRGLIVRHDWWNPEVILLKGQIERLFTDNENLDWGVLSGGEFQVEGSFDELIRPLILDSVEAGEPVCKELPTGTTTRPAIWPSEYASLHYYAFYRPAPADGNPFNWRTWTFGFEYIDGRPYLTLLVQYRGDI